MQAFLKNLVEGFAVAVPMSALGLIMMRVVEVAMRRGTDKPEQSQIARNQ